MRPSFNLFVVAALLLAETGTATADIVTFDDRTTFISASAASPIGPIPLGGATDPNFVIGDFTFTAEPISTFHLILPDFGIRIPGFDLAVNFSENFNVDSAVPLFSFGFDFHEPENDPEVSGAFIESEFEVTLRNSGAFVNAFTFERPNDSLQFVGVLSNQPFDRVEIREIAGGIENEFFGNFVAGTTAVPEPSTLGAIFATLLTLVVRRKQLHKST